MEGGEEEEDKDVEVINIDEDTEVSLCNFCSAVMQYYRFYFRLT